MMSTHRHTGLANAGKVAQLADLFPAFRHALVGLQRVTVREILAGQPLTSWRAMPTGSLPFTTPLSARQMKSVQNQLHAAMSSWQELLTGTVRDLITGSSLTGHRAIVLYRINANKAWWATELDLPWRVTSDGELTPIGPKAAEKAVASGALDVVWLPVEPEDLKLARRLAKRAMHTAARLPNLSRVHTVNLDSIIARPEAATAAHSAAWWVKIATLTKGKPIWMPLATNTYFERQYRSARKVCGTIQLHLTPAENGQPARVDASLILEHENAPARTEGREIGLDWGMSSALFATSDGRLLGAKMLHTLAQWDIRLNRIAADLQRAGTPLKQSPEYVRLNQRIRDYVTNEIGRLLNNLANHEGEHVIAALVVERLDFRGGGLSRRLNRLITRTGRAVVKARLKALTDKHGITIHVVNAAHTSRECSGCCYVSKNNRQGRHFTCRFCGKKIHADINAARTVKGRRSLPHHDHATAAGRGSTLRMLDQRHQQRWRLRPTLEADPALAGRQAKTAA